MGNETVFKNWFNSGHDIYLDEFYYISYADQKFKIAEFEKKNKYKKYFDIMKWPETELKYKTLAELHPDENPKYIKISGRMLLEWSEKGFIPQFDMYFEKTRRLVMIPLEGWEFFNENSYMLRNKAMIKEKT